MGRYSRNKVTNGVNPLTDAIVVPSAELEECNQKYFESMSAFFSAEQIEEMKKVRSRKDFYQYCHDKGLEFLPGAFAVDGNS